MANVKITELTALTAADSASTDVLPIVDVSADATKKLAISDLHRSVPDGTLSAPGIAFQSDLNSGLYRSGTDAIALVTNGAARILIDANGDVTIPNDLTVQGTTTCAFGAGTAAAPSITFVDDSDTGLYRPAANEIGLVTAGTDRVRIDSSGTFRVKGSGTAGVNDAVQLNGSAPANSLLLDASGRLGLGTTSPSYTLDVNGNGRFTGQVTCNDVVASSTNDTFPVFRGLNAAGTATNFRVNGDGSGYFTGSLGIGTSTGDAKLTVNSSGARAFEIENAGSSDSKTLTINQGNANNGATNTVLDVGSSSGNSILTTGNVGIGTASPTFSNGSGLEIQRDGVSTLRIEDSSGLGAVLEIFADDGSRSAIYDSRGNSSNHGHEFRVNGSPKVNIDSNGRVGIGTTSPGQALDVKGNIQTIGTNGWTTNGDTAWVYFGDNNNRIGGERGGTIAFYADYAPMEFGAGGGTGAASSVQLITFKTGTSERLRIDSSGMHTITASNNSTAVQIRDASNYAGQLITATDGTFEINARTTTRFTRTGSALESMLIDSTGNVGIGTTGPGEILEIKKDSPDPFNTVQTHLKLTNGGGNSGAGNRIVFATGTTQALIQAKVSGGNSNSGTDLEFYTHSTTGTPTTPRLIIDSSGRLLVGTSSFTGEASAVLEGSSAGGTAQAQLWLNRGSTPTTDNVLGQIIFGDNNAAGRNGAMIQARADSSWASGDYPTRLVFSTTADGESSPDERMIISSLGETKISHSNTNANLLFIHNTDTNAGTRLSVIKGGTTNSSDTTTKLISFERNDGTEIGKIRRGGFSSVAYDTSSDYRIKANIVPLASAIERVKQFNPVRFNWAEDTSDTPTVLDGFLAHEVQTVVPEAASGHKDEVDDDGNPVIQGIDQSKLVPLLTAALQEAIAKIETLEQRLSDAGIA